jgi:hypothetical protein
MCVALIVACAARAYGQDMVFSYEEDACVERMADGTDHTMPRQERVLISNAWVCSARRGTPAPPASDLPQTPSRIDLVSEMQRVAPDVVACAAPSGIHGTLTAELSIGADGSTESVRRMSASSCGVPPALPTSRIACLARHLCDVSVPAFAQPHFTLRYPFRF